MNVVNMPGFTAEASLHNVAVYSRNKQFPINIRDSSEIVPQLPLPPQLGSCGPCTPITWPNGTPTGACRQDCTDILGEPYSRACRCPLGGGTSAGAHGGLYYFFG